MKKYILPISWMIFIFILSSFPGDEIPKLSLYGADKIAHFALYSVLGFLWARALGSEFILILSIGIFYGLVDEIHQIYVPLRGFSYFDLLFDIIGIINGIICRQLLKKYRLAR